MNHNRKQKMKSTERGVINWAIQAKVRAFQKDTIFNVRAPSHQGYDSCIGLVVFISQRPSFPFTRPSKINLPIKKSTLRIPFIASARSDPTLFRYAEVIRFRSSSSSSSLLKSASTICICMTLYISSNRSANVTPTGLPEARTSTYQGTRAWYIRINGAGGSHTNRVNSPALGGLVRSRKRTVDGAVWMSQYTGGSCPLYRR